MLVNRGYIIISFNLLLLNHLISLRPHQLRALNIMQREDKGQIIVPTGGGKTYIMINDYIAMLQECNEGESDLM